MRKLAFYIISFSFVIVDVQITFANVINDECGNALNCKFCYSKGSTIDATPSEILSNGNCNPETKDVWYKTFNIQCRYLLAYTYRDSGRCPELGVFIKPPKDTLHPENNDVEICSEIDCFDLEDSPTAFGLGYQRGRTAHPQSSVFIPYTGPLGYDAVIVVKEAYSDVDGPFIVRLKCLHEPVVYAGALVQYHCLSSDIMYDLRGDAYTTSGEKLDNFQWSLIKEYYGRVDTIINAETSRPKIKFSGSPPYKAEFELRSIITHYYEFCGGAYRDSIPGYDTTTLIVHNPTLDYPDTVWVKNNVPRRISDNMLTTGCLDIEEKFTWTPSYYLAYPNTRNPIVTTKRDRTYIVEMDCSGCVDTEKVVVKIGDPPIGVKDELAPEIYFCQSRLILKNIDINALSLFIKLFDIKGRQVLNFEVSDFNLENDVISIDVGKYKLRKGIYFVVASIGDLIVNTKVLLL
jgi:hypothetical protein